MDVDSNVDDAARELEKAFRALGFGACRACMANPCRWQPTVDAREVAARRAELSDELHFVKMHPELKMMNSVVPCSVHRGGSPVFRREDLQFALFFEDKALERDLRLCGIDRECHDAFASTKVGRIRGGGGGLT